jgi:hypothetical protein
LKEGINPPSFLAMITINIEIRYANSMVGCPEYSQTTKEEALVESVQEALEGVFAKYPKLRGMPYYITPSKKWQRLSKKVYWFKDDPSQGCHYLCFIKNKGFNFPESEVVPIYLIFPYNSDMVPLRADLMETDDFLDS